MRGLLATGVLYWATIYPRTQRELRRWHRRAASIPDPTLRAHALGKLTAERLNPEAAALFASTAPKSRRTAVIDVIVAYQLLYDYLDAVNEWPGSRRLANGLRLHGALTDALRPATSIQDLYLANPQKDDKDYAACLGSACGRALETLPGSASVAEILLSAAERCRQAQARNHAIPDWGARALQCWCQKQLAATDLLWWETAAAGISCLGVHALLALAADPVSQRVDAVNLDAAYFPGVCAISALLDSLADHRVDDGTPNHSFTAHYRSTDEAAERLIAITRQTAARLNRLGHRDRHEFILNGIVAFYLSAATLHPSFSASVAEAMMDASTVAARTMRSAMRLRRRVVARRYSAVE